MISDESHYLALAASCCRGRLGDLAGDDAAAAASGEAAGLRLHRFKRTAELPRVRRVIGALAAPAGRDGDGLPIGVQIVGPLWSELRLLEIVRALEKADILPGFRPPPLS